MAILRIALTLAIALCSACASDPSLCPTEDPSDLYPAAHPAVPMLVSLGGPVLDSPRVVPIFYRGYPHRTQLLSFMSMLGGSVFWSATTAEYGIGALTVSDPVDLTEPAPITITQDELEAWLVDRLHSGALGALDPEAIYTLYLPPGSSYVRASGKSCVASNGYHASVLVDGQSFAYAIIATCESFGPLDGLDATTAISSHEWVEAATDPQDTQHPAFASLDRDALAWALVFGVESADLCEQYGTSFATVPDLGFAVQRAWSNARAVAGTNPCAPAPPDEIYFAAAPDVDSSGVVHIGVGESKTIDVALFSDKPIEPWSLTAADYTASTLGFDSQLRLSWDCATGQNGDTRHLKISVDRPGSGSLEIVTITSSLDGRKSVWPITIMN